VWDAEIPEAMCELAAAAEGEGWSLSEGAARQLAQWAELVMAWRARGGLTAARTTDAVVQDLMLPAVYALRVVSDAGSVLDLGCGSGCTGVTLAVLRGQGQWYLVDHSEPKIIFCRYAINQCGIAGLNAHTRREALAKGLQADIVLARAVPRTRDTLEDARKLAKPGAALVQWVKAAPRCSAGQTIRCGGRNLWVVVGSVGGFT
jgi:16S rRNA G527 N7-methylase RsmG